jgi:hypothetical protein
VKLLELPENAQEHIACGDFSAAHGHKILLAPADKRAELVEWLENETVDNKAAPTVGELSHHMDYRLGRKLDRACFPIDVEYAGAPACATCPHNAAAQAVLFDAQAEGQCLNRECFEAKTAAFDKELGETAAKKFKGMEYLGVKDVSSCYRAGTYISTIGKGTIVVKDELIKKPEIKAAMKANPEKFAYFVREGEHKAYAVITDKALINELFPSEKKETLTPEQKLAQQEDGFVSKFITLAYVKAMLSAKKGLPDTLLMQLCPEYFYPSGLDTVICEAFGLKGYDSKTRKKLTADQVLKLVWLKTKTDYSTISLEPADLKEFGLDIKKIKTTAAAEAKAAWQQEIIKRAEAAAKTKKGKKPARQEEQEEETGEEGDDE